MKGSANTIMGDDDRNPQINERLAIAETEISVIKDDITGIKSDISGLKNGQFETNLTMKELTILLSESNKTHTVILEQNSKVMEEVIKKVDEINQKNDERYIQSIKDASEMKVEIKTKSDKFKDFLVDTGISVLKYALAGGLIYYILYLTKIIK